MKLKEGHFISQSSSIEALVDCAARIIAPVRPLTQATLSNPLVELQDLPFWDAVQQAETLMHPSEELLNILNARPVNDHLIKWCQAFLDEGQATFKMPQKEKGFYQAWYHLASFDRTLCPSKKERRYLATFPADAKEAIIYGFDQLQIKSDHQELYLKYALAQLPGWAGYIKWRTHSQTNPITLLEFLAVRLSITALLGPSLTQQRIEKPPTTCNRAHIEASEHLYATTLVEALLSTKQKLETKQKILAQLVFCMDVRAEPLRRQLEAQGDWETFGCAGSFGIPTLMLKNPQIPLDEQIAYAESALRIMGLHQDFAPLVVFCGHGSASKNNPHASSFNCGACEMNKGGAYARCLASILNTPTVRSALKLRGIAIPPDTCFIGAEHHTVTDQVTLFDPPNDPLIEQLKQGLETARQATGYRRSIHRGHVDWSDVRPEWGNAKNAALIVGPRALSQHLDLQGRCFLHGYDGSYDGAGQYLEKILTGALVVAHGINAHYFFATCYPTLYGSGSKVTQNIVGKIGVMQGNASDLMQGLPLQAVYAADDTPYHEPLRLLTIVYAVPQKLDAIIQKHSFLKQLFFNHWVKLIAIDPNDRAAYQLQSANSWIPVVYTETPARKNS